MPRSRQFGSTRPGRGNRRLTDWAAGPFSAPQDLSAAGPSLWDTAQSPLIPGLTVVRVRGEFTIVLNAITTVGDGFNNFAVGIGVASLAAFTAGVASLPTPLTEIEWPGWLWHSSHGELQGMSITESGQSPLEALRGVIDSKAMRKLRTDEVIFGAIEMGTEVGTAVASFSARTRMLVKLP